MRCRPGTALKRARAGRREAPTAIAPRIRPGIRGITTHQGCPIRGWLCPDRFPRASVRHTMCRQPAAAPKRASRPALLVTETPWHSGILAQIAPSLITVAEPSVNKLCCHYHPPSHNSSSAGEYFPRRVFPSGGISLRPPRHSKRLAGAAGLMRDFPPEWGIRAAPASHTRPFRRQTALAQPTPGPLAERRHTPEAAALPSEALRRRPRGRQGPGRRAVNALDAPAPPIRMEDGRRARGPRGARAALSAGSGAAEA